MPETPSEWASAAGGFALWLAAVIAWWSLADAILHFRAAKKKNDPESRKLEEEQARGKLVATTLGDLKLVTLVGLGLAGQAAGAVLAYLGR
ncbi:MAG: hypothetical protein ACFE0P_10655 [Oceanicaulis sp.]